MTDIVIPAPLWRRFAAALYDGLIFIAIWAIVVQAFTLVRLAIGAEDHPTLLRALVFSAGLLFFGWFWTHGGQTVGMRAWRLQVRRSDGTPLRWPVAATRYALMLLWASVLLTPPVMLMLPSRINFPNRHQMAIGAAILAMIGLIAQKRDGRRRAPHDWLSNTEVVQIPKRPA